jgi:hypothetical protein
MPDSISTPLQAEATGPRARVVTEQNRSLIHLVSFVFAAHVLVPAPYLPPPTSRLRTADAGCVRLACASRIWHARQLRRHRPCTLLIYSRAHRHWYPAWTACRPRSSRTLRPSRSSMAGAPAARSRRPRMPSGAGSRRGATAPSRCAARARSVRSPRSSPTRSAAQARSARA